MDVDRGIDKAPHESLSDREFEILCLIASGKTISEIAALISRSVKTVSTYRARILAKMGLIPMLSSPIMPFTTAG